MKKRIISVIVAVVLVVSSVLVTSAVKNKKLEAYKLELEKSQANVEELQTKAEALQANAEAYRTNAEVLQTELQLAEEEKLNNGKAIIDLIKKVDYADETVYVIGHKTPDADTAGSAIGMAFLLNELGIPAEARITADINLETEYAYSELNCKIPEILDDATEKQLWLVDHSTTSQMVNGADNARIVGITDHHGIGNAETTELICVLSCPAGATCSVICKLCDACGVVPDKETAYALLVGLLSDTSNMKSSAVTKLDEDAFELLKSITGMTDTDTLYDGMLEAKLSYKGLDDREIYYSDYKDYEFNGFRYGVGSIKVAHTEQIPAMAERMQDVIRAEMEKGIDSDFILYQVYDSEYELGYIGIVGKDISFIEKLMGTAFGDKAKKDGEYYVLSPSLNRKKELIPAIDEFLDTIK